MRMRAWRSLRAAALPVETRRFNPTRSSVVSVTQYFSIVGLLFLKDAREDGFQETVSHNTRQSKIDGTLGSYFMLSTASLSAVGYEYNLSQPVIWLWNDTRHVGS